MKIMLLLILISLLLAAGFLLIYLWAARSGQFDDDYTPSVRILFDDTSFSGGAAPGENKGSAEVETPLPPAEPGTKETNTATTK